MPFHREWDREAGTYTINRDRTGPVAPPETGTTAQAEGFVVIANQETLPDVPPATPVKVNFPGPNEPIVGANGMITPRWWRFLDELYRRTGGPVDNINKAPSVWLPPSIDTLVLSGVAPTVVVSNNAAPGAGSISVAEQDATVVVSNIAATSVGSISITGQDADRTVV